MYMERAGARESRVCNAFVSLRRKQKTLELFIHVSK